jgi:hypothetical protein
MEEVSASDRELEREASLNDRTYNLVVSPVGIRVQ